MKLFVQVFRIGLILVIFGIIASDVKANDEQSETLPDSLSRLDANSKSMAIAHLEKQNRINPINEHPLNSPSNNERASDVNKTPGRASEKKRGHGRRRKLPKARRHRKGHRERAGRDNRQRMSCKVKTLYSSKTTANDIFGDVVDVAPYISFGETNLKQYFYEQYCDKERCGCHGTNKKKYQSSCETSYGYTLARISKHGVTGWAYILVRTGCNCIIEDREPETKSIHDFLF